MEKPGEECVEEDAGKDQRKYIANEVAPGTFKP
jgi:hypothetical protein